MIKLLHEAAQSPKALKLRYWAILIYLDRVADSLSVTHMLSSEAGRQICRSVLLCPCYFCITPLFVLRTIFLGRISTPNARLLHAIAGAMARLSSAIDEISMNTAVRQNQGSRPLKIFKRGAILPLTSSYRIITFTFCLLPSQADICFSLFKGMATDHDDGNFRPISTLYPHTPGLHLSLLPSGPVSYSYKLK